MHAITFVTLRDGKELYLLSLIRVSLIYNHHAINNIATCFNYNYNKNRFLEHKRNYHG